MDYYYMYVTHLDNATQAARKAHDFFWAQLQDSIPYLGISPSLRLCGDAKNAHIADRELAERAKEFCEKLFKLKYGQETKIEFYKQSSRFSLDRLEKRIERDSSKLIESIGKTDLNKMIAKANKEKWFIEITGQDIPPSYLISIKDNMLNVTIDKDYAQGYVSQKRIGELTSTINNGFGNKYHARQIRAFTQKPKLELVVK